MVGPAVQEIHQPLDHLAVRLTVDRADAGAVAQLDIVVEAGARILAVDLAVAGQIGKNAAHQIERLVHGPNGRVGAKVARAVAQHPPRDRHLRVIIRPMHLDIRVALIIFEADIVVRLVLLDQRVFKQQRFQLRVGGDDLDIGDVAAQALRLNRIDIVMEIRAHPAAQIDRLANIDDFAILIFVQVNARLGGQILQDLLHVWRWCKTHGAIISKRLMRVILSAAKDSLGFFGGPQNDAFFNE